MMPQVHPMHEVFRLSKGALQAKAGDAQPQLAA
jgi:hypothetical protein